MKNKKLTYLLIVVVAAVWGIIVWRVIGYNASETSPGVTQSTALPEQVDRIRYELSLDYRDPFLESTTPRIRRARSEAGTGISPESEPIIPPNACFKGVIRQHNRLYAIFESDGRSEILQQGEAVDEYRLTSVTPDSVLLEKGTQVFVLKLQ